MSITLVGDGGGAVSKSVRVLAGGLIFVAAAVVTAQSSNATSSSGVGTAAPFGQAQEAISFARAGAAPRVNTSPVGTWAGQVESTAGIFPVELALRANGTVCIVSTNDNVEGTGIWYSRSGQVWLHMMETYTEGGAPAGGLWSVQSGRVNSDAMSLRGTTGFLDEAGNTQFTVQVTSRLNRKSATPAC